LCKLSTAFVHLQKASSYSQLNDKQTIFPSKTFDAILKIGT